MPRLSLKKTEYMAADLYAYIIGQMVTKGITQKELGEELGLSQQVTSSKLRRKALSTKELIATVNYLEIEGQTIARMFGRE